MDCKYENLLGGMRESMSNTSKILTEISGKIDSLSNYSAQLEVIAKNLGQIAEDHEKRIRNIEEKSPVSVGRVLVFMTLQTAILGLFLYYGA